MQLTPEQLDRIQGELKLRRSQMSRYPFCPDHRDKVYGRPCRECTVETMRKLLVAARHLLLVATGPEDGPTSWIETRESLFRRMDEYAEVKHAIDE